MSSTVCYYCSPTKTGGFVYSRFDYNNSTAGNPNWYLYLHSFVNGTLIYSDFWHRDWFFHIWRLKTSSPLFFHSPMRKIWCLSGHTQQCSCGPKTTALHFHSQLELKGWWTITKKGRNQVMLTGGWMWRGNALPYMGQVVTSPMSPAVLRFCKRKLQSTLFHLLKADSWNCGCITGYWDF